MQQVLDFIIIFGAAYFTVLKIIDSFAKPTSKFRKKAFKKRREEIEAVVDEMMPEYFEDYSIEGKKRAEKITLEMQDSLEEIKQINLKQNKLLKTLSTSSKDMLRYQIMDIYRAYKGVRTLPIDQKEALDELYKDYKAEGGNSYIDKYYKRMELWNIVYEDYEKED